MGSRDAVPLHILEYCRDERVALISIDYRLAPQVQLPAIIEDLRDAFRWISNRGARVAGLDLTKVAVAGASAGGYLTLMSGFAVEPKPLALVSYYGYGDVDSDWYTRPSEHYRRVVSLYDGERARAELGDDTVTAPLSQTQADARRRYYHYLRQNGLWTRAVTGFDPATQREKLDPYCPVRNVSPTDPPTMLIHGTADTDVPYECSVEMARELEHHGVEHELVTVSGAEHGLVDVDPALVNDAHARAATFLSKYLG
jgi:acetyl esterase/lipase